METTERQKRELEKVTEKEKISHILNKFLLNVEMNVKEHPPDLSGKITKVSPEMDMIMVKVSLPDDFLDGGEYSFYRVLSRYVRIDTKVIQKKPDNAIVFKVLAIYLSKKDRAHNRFQIPSGMVWITNVVTTNNSIDANMHVVPTSVKVNFTDYENKLRPLCDFVKIDTFGQSQDDKLRYIKKTGKCLLISDTQNKDSYSESLSEDFINYENDIDDDIDSVVRNYKNNKIRSEIIVPIIYVGLDNESIPIGYIQMQSKTQNFDITKVMEIKGMGFEMVDRIRSSNTLVISDRFQVIDLSEGGLKVKIDHPDLIKTLPHVSGFTFDLYFKLQAPITNFGIIRSIKKNPDGSLSFGLALSGNSSRQGERKRFLDMLENLKKNLPDVLPP